MAIAYTSTAQTPNLGTISKNKEVKYVAVGSSLSAGVRDGGLTAESQENAFPVLLAKQMGIVNFKVPILAGKGTNRNYQTVDKNGATSSIEIKGDFDDKIENVSLPKITGSTDNLAIPFQKMIYSSTNRFELSIPKQNFAGDRKIVYVSVIRNGVKTTERILITK